MNLKTLLNNRQILSLANVSLILSAVLCFVVLLVVGFKAPSLTAQYAASGAAELEPLPEAMHIQAQSVFVFDLAQKKTLFQKNADAQLPLASLTKIMLVLAIAEVLDPDEMVAITRDAVARGNGGLTRGEIWRVRDLIDITLVMSSNVGAEALAEAADSRLKTKYPRASEGATVWRMNELAREIGMSRTYFLNPTGLDVSATQPGALGSARDVAILLAYARTQASDLFAATEHTTVSLKPQNGDRAPTENTNEALPSIPGLILGKTGYTVLAGGNLGILFEIGLGRPLVAVVLKSTQDGRFGDIRRIVDAANAAIAQ